MAGCSRCSARVRRFAEILEDHVGLIHELPKNLESLFGLQVDEDTALGAVDVVVPQHGALVRAVDLDDVGSEFGHGAAAGGAGEDDAEVYYLHALQR